MDRGGGRRDFLVKTLQTGACTLVGGVVWGALIHESRAKPFALRPPGAQGEPEYLGTCIRCGQCVDACPFDTLRLGRSGESGTMGVPRFEPRETPCYMCPDVPCARACPTGALEREVRIDDARMGLAVLIDQETCLAFQGLRCEVCYRVCPLMGRAITLRFRPNERTGRHAFFEPVVLSQSCTGCGMCEHACPLEAPAIRVLPRRLAQGRLGRGYRWGWKEESHISRDFQPGDTRFGPEARRWEQDALDNALKSLEETEPLYDNRPR